MERGKCCSDLRCEGSIHPTADWSFCTCALLGFPALWGKNVLVRAFQLGACALLFLDPFRGPGRFLRRRKPFQPFGVPSPSPLPNASFKPSSGLLKDGGRLAHAPSRSSPRTRLRRRRGRGRRKPSARLFAHPTFPRAGGRALPWAGPRSNWPRLKRRRRGLGGAAGTGGVGCGAALRASLRPFPFSASSRRFGAGFAPRLAAKMMGPRPVLVLSQNTKRESGRKVQTGNITAAKTIADIIRTCLGPRAMMKMLLDPMGGIVMTNDGNAILREIQVQHPAAKSMIEISRTQDEEVGDGTTSVIILAGEMLAVAEHFLEQQMHPTVVIGAYRKALDDMIAALKKISTPVDSSNREAMLKIIQSAISTKVISQWSELACSIALDAVKTVELEENGRKEIDIKKYAKVEKIPGGFIEDSCVLRGIMLNKDITHPRMRRTIKNPRIVLLDCSLEYKKGESQTDIEITREEDFNRILQMEEEFIQQMCEHLIRVKPDLIITEKGISDLAQHFLMRANISAIRRVRKTDNNRIARACGARIVSRTEELREEDVGTGARLFEVKKIGDEYFTFITDCKEPKACTILLRGASKEILAEVERNLHDAMQVCRNVLVDPQLVPGGGASEMAVAHVLTEKSKVMTGVEQWPYRAVAQALEVIPRTLIQNCGASTIRLLTSLRAKHTQEGSQTWGVNGETGALVDMKELGVWEPLAVKLQTYKTAVETAVLLLRIDDIVSGHKKKGSEQSKQPGAPTEAHE
ncbi:hypothetical protein lerEdw1_013487 [Lerista edwardsae]|nr:hypothetical protein lerEdw1_013487 [Lerista edwardsae]